MGRHEKVFTIFDYVVFVSVLVASLSVGVYYTFSKKTKKTTAHFLMGDGKLHMLPVSISILVSFLSAIAILGLPAEMYTEGTMFIYVNFGMAIGCLLASFTFVPLLYPLRLTSSYEYLAQRFQSKAAEVTGSIISIIQQVLYIGIACYAPSTALKVVTNIPEWATIVTVSLVATIYTTMGGMKAVIWTDFFQAGVMMAGILAVVIQSFLKVGSIERVLEENENWNRIQFDEISFDPRVKNTVWSLLIGATVQWLIRYGILQASVQRYSALQGLKQAKQSLYINSVGVFVITTLSCLSGVAIFAYYAMIHCDPLTSGKVSNPNQIVPYFVMETLNYPGLPGLLVASLFSGALSTVSSSLNGLAAISWETFLKHKFGHLSEETRENITRSLVAIFGLLGMVIAFICQRLKGPVTQVAISFDGVSGGPLLGIFLLGSLFPQANSKGCIVGGIVSLVGLLWMSIGKLFISQPVSLMQYPNCSYANISDAIQSDNTVFQDELILPIGFEGFYHVSYLWYPVIGMIVTLIVGMFTSWLTGFTKSADVDDKYLFTIAKYFPLSSAFSRNSKYSVELKSTLSENVSQSTTSENFQHISTDRHTQVYKGL